MYYRARYYASGLGRFVSADTIVPSAGNPADLNRYAYARNSPVKYVDPDGHIPIPSWTLRILQGAIETITTNFNKAIEAYNAGESRSGVLAMHATGATGALVQMAEDINHLNEDTGVVFSNAPLEERLPHCAHLGIWATETAATIVAVGQVASMVKGAGTQSMRLRYDPSLPAGSGATDIYGNMSISPQGTALDQTPALLHEQVHARLTPSGALLEARAQMNGWVYRNSHLARYTEEALAESVAQLRTGGSLLQGLSFPVTQGYVNPFITSAEGGALAGGLAWIDRKLRRLEE